MAEVLVLVDHVDGRLRKATAELLTAAARLGEPSAVHIGAGAEKAQVTLAKYGAHKVYVVDDADAAAYLVAPQAEILAALVEKVSPAAVLIPSNASGKEIAARLAIKTGSGPHHRRRRRRGRRARHRDHPVGLRRLVHRHRHRDARAPRSSR